MKSPVLSLVAIIFTICLLAQPDKLWSQYENWSDAVSLTDSVTDNTNPVIGTIYFPDFDFYMFWEKSTEPSSTAIYYQKFYNEDSPHVFMATEGVHYSNPHMVNTKHYPSNDSLFYVFYESDEEGYNNIYYRIYNEDGFTGPQALTGSTEEKTNMLCNRYGRIVWMEQNRIMHARLDVNSYIIDEPVMIDSGNCSSPAVIEWDAEWGDDVSVVAWIKEVNDSSRIMIREYSMQNGWLDPEVVFTGPQCLNLSYCTGIGSPEVLTWDYFDNTSWRIVFYDNWGDQEFITEFDQQNPFYPKFYSGFIPVSRWFEAGMCTMIYENEDGPGVYTAPYYYSVYAPLDAYQMVSTPGNLVHNPQLFTGKSIGCNQYFINIWEEQVNDHWQLKYSTSYACLSGLEENNEPLLDLKAGPNPFNGETVISFSIDRPSDVLLTIEDLTGKKVATLVSEKLNAGQYSFKWNGAAHAPGVYLVTLRSGRTVTTKKLILSK